MSKYAFLQNLKQVQKGHQKSLELKEYLQYRFYE